ncbi:MAG: hypothetical protein LBO72_01205 [Helicobacteraceae bacterium]|jgi:hypothetical protein|nr:hypothetical protein [Helicobacteraceae bacterium]
MRLKRYTLLSLLLLVALGILVYMNDSSDYSAHIGEESYTLPIAVWAMLPAIIVFAVSFSHIAFYATAAFLQKNQLNKELKLLKKLVMNALIGQKSDVALKNAQLSAIGKTIAISKLTPLTSAQATGEDDLDALMSIVERVNKGEAVDLSAFKPVRSSQLWIANQRNRMLQDAKVSEEILKEADENSDIYKQALEIYATYGDKKRFLKSESAISAQTALNLLSRWHATDNGLEFDKDEAIALCARAAFTSRHYIDLARILHANLAPDVLLGLFLQLKNITEQACGAWIYINIEFERLDEVSEMLENSAKDEYLPFKSYIALKNAGLQPSMDTLLTCAF